MRIVKIIIVNLLVFATPWLARAYIYTIWSDQELHDMADLVIIAKPVSTQYTSEKMTHPRITPDIHIVGLSTKFEISMVIKGDKSLKEITLHHYRVADTNEQIVPYLISFDPKKQPLDRFLMFLSLESDGRYSPVSGHFDPGHFSILKLSHIDVLRPDANLLEIRRLASNGSSQRGLQAFSLFAAPPLAAPDAGVYLANGFKIGEVTGTTAILWTRTCATPNANHVPHNNKHPKHPALCLPPKNFAEIPPASRPANIAGKSAHVRFTLTPIEPSQAMLGSNPSALQPFSPSALSTPWLPATEATDYCIQTTITDLNPGTTYTVTVEAILAPPPAGSAEFPLGDGGTAATSPRAAPPRSTGREAPPIENRESQIQNSPNSPASRLTGSFRTPPAIHTSTPLPITAVATSCQHFWDHDDEVRGFKIYDSMSRLNPAPDFIVFQGDYVYYDRKGDRTTSIEMARAHWHAQNTWPALLDFYRTHPAYFTKDDHDTLFDDCNPHVDFTKFAGPFTFADGVRIYNEQLPQPPVPYRTHRWGADLQIWLLEGREYRTTKNNAPDGPHKSLLGPAQKTWLARTLAESDAPFKIIFSPTPIVGPDYDKGKNDNLSNLAWATEGAEIRRLLARHNAIVINGDRHWQYHSIDPETGLREFSKGPATTQHILSDRVWDSADFRDMHHYLRVAGGFLSLTVERDNNNTPQITLRFHDVDGQVNHTRTYNAAGQLLRTFHNTQNPDAGKTR